MQLTTKQFLIMSVIVTGNRDGSFVDLDQVIERLSYTTTKQALQFPIRALVRKGLIEKKPREKRRGRSRVILAPTRAAYVLMRPE